MELYAHQSRPEFVRPPVAGRHAGDVDNRSCCTPRPVGMTVMTGCCTVLTFLTLVFSQEVLMSGKAEFCSISQARTPTSRITSCAKWLKDSASS